MESWVERFEKYCNECEKRRLMRPICSCCGDNIQTEKYLEISGEMYCWDCVEENTHFSDMLDD